MDGRMEGWKEVWMMDGWKEGMIDEGRKEERKDG